MTIPLIQFSLLIPIQNRVREFNFRKRSADRYDGNTTDERGNRYYFQLIEQGDQWKLDEGSLPDWLRGNEAGIIRALTEREKNGG